MPAPDWLCGQPCLYFKTAIVNLKVKRPFKVKAHTTVFEVNKNSCFRITDSGKAHVVLRLEDRRWRSRDREGQQRHQRRRAACCADSRTVMCVLNRVPLSAGGRVLVTVADVS